MIRLDKIGKQNGRQIVFIEASAALQKGEKAGLVGPNGAGKTTLFRMMTGQEQPDEGQVSSERGITIGYFSQDVGEMAGRTVVAEVMDGAGPVSVVAAELKELEAGLADPDRADEMEALIERYGEVQARFEELDGYALEGRAYEVLARLLPGDDGRRCRPAFGRLEDARRARPHPADAPRRDAARRAEQPPRPRKPDLARSLPQGL
jgi:ATPase subunit of ABC transporter with duplicated ATPase domains